MYFHKVEEFLNRWKQTQAIIKNHNLSVGLICEEILREFLRQFLPDRIGLTPGFIENDRSLSNQCDIIIYDKLNFAPLYSFGGISIIPSESVFAVVEVKSTLNYAGFCSTLESFERLKNMGVMNKYLFTFRAGQIKTIKQWFYRFASRNQPDMEDNVYVGEWPIDKPDFEYYPKAILDISQNLYLHQDHVPTGKRDMLGYSNYEIRNTDGIATSCLQCFVADIIGHAFETESSETYTDKITDIKAIYEIKRYSGFGLCDL